MHSSSSNSSNLSPSENIRCAVEHLRAVADKDFSHLYFEAHYARWKEQTLMAHTVKIALQILSCHPQTARSLQPVSTELLDLSDNRNLKKEFRHLDA